MAKIIDKKTHIYPYLDKPVDIYTLENGHKIVIANKSGDLVNVSTWVKTGSIHEDDKISGISHFLEHLMFKGTPTHPAGDFDKILEAKGAIVNAATWKDYTFYYVTYLFYIASKKKTNIINRVVFIKKKKLVFINIYSII